MTEKEDKKPAIHEIYDVDDFIDAKDNQGDWRVGYIIDKNNITKTFKVRFDGWAAKYDEIYRFGHPKLQQFRSVITGYTGQKQLPSWRPSWSFIQQKHEKKILQLVDYVKNGNEQKIKTAHDFNQWIRGHNYFYVDFLMSTHFQQASDVQKVIEFFKINIKLCVDYLKYIINNFEKFVFHLQKNNGEHLIDVNVAKSMAFYEIFDMVYIMTGSYPRFTGFFKDNEEFLKIVLNTNKKDIKPAYQIHIIEYFYKSGGFQSIDQILKLIKKSNKSIPFIFLSSLAHLYTCFSSYLPFKVKEFVIKNFKFVTEKNIQYLGDKQMKDFYQQEVVNLIFETRCMSDKTPLENQMENWSCAVEMQVYYKMITCPYFQKKLRGITSLQQYIEKNVEDLKQFQQSDIIHNGTVKNWIEQKKLFQILLSTDNAQLIKKSTQLIKYLYNHDFQIERYIELLWKYREGKHETVLKQIYNFIGQIPIHDKNGLFTMKFFKQYLAKVDQSEWNHEFIKMIKDYTLHALLSFEGDDVQETYGLQIIYQYVQKYPHDEVLIGYLIDVCKRIEKTPFLDNFVFQSFHNIQQNKNSNFYVSILVKILKQKIVDIKNIKINCLNVIIDNILQQKNSDMQNLDMRFELLNNCLKQAEVIISLQTFIQFWNLFVDSKGRESFFKWLYKIKNSGKVTLTFYINMETKAYLLDHFWTEDYLHNHKFQQCDAVFLLELFKYINQKQKKIRRQGVVIEVLDQNLTGIQKLHGAYQIIENQRVTEILSRGLAQIYTCSGQNLKEMGIDLVTTLIDKIFQEISSSIKNSNQKHIKKMIRLIQQLILRDQQIYYTHYNPKVQLIKTIKVKNCLTNQQKELRVNSFQIVYYFKKIISEKFGIPLHLFDLIINDEEIDYHSYFKNISEIDIKGTVFIKHKNHLHLNIKNQLQHHLDLLFDLLGNKSIEDRVWNIVSKLPISNQVREKILQTQNPLKILQNTCFYKQLYMLRVALSLQQKWWNLPVEDMIKFFLFRLQNTGVSTEIERQYLVVSAKLLQKVIQLDQLPNSKVFIETFRILFQILKRILIQTNQMPNLNPQYVKKFITTFFRIGDLLNQYLQKNLLKGKESDALGLMLADPNIQNLFQLCLIDHKNQEIKKEFPYKLQRLSTVNKEKYADCLASIILNQLLDSTVESPNKNLRQYKMFACIVMQTMDSFLGKFFSQHKSIFFHKLFKLIQDQPTEQNCETVNVTLNCYLSLVRYVLPQVSQADIEKFFLYIYNECLFKRNLSKCKSKQSRSSIFSLFLKIIKQRKRPDLIFNFFGQLQVNGLWRSRRIQDWTINHSDRLKSSTGYTGIKNLGCICYMNSFFQQIFMIQQFRRALLIADDPLYEQIPLTENVLFQVKKMFLNLMFSDKKAYNPKSFCLAFKDYEGNPTNVNEQMDIDEFSGILFDRLQTSLKVTKHANLIKQTFGGVFSNQIICKGCPHFSQTEQSFLSLPLTVKDKRSIYESLQTMIKGDTLDGENAYHCERCSKKVSAVKRVCLKKLPNYLIVALKRFEFDFNTMQKLKINDYCEFPQELNLEQYSYEYLRKKQNPKAYQQQQIKSKKYYQYRLKGVVIHIGYADSGHYYSLIQERKGEERWIEFNDSIVRKFNLENLRDQAFGGETGGIQSKEKIKNAYLLIYERVEKINSNKDQVDKFGNSFTNFRMYQEVMETIQKQNFQNNIQNIIFSSEYIKFTLNMIDEAGKDKGNLSLHKYIVLSFLTTILRAKTDPSSFEILQKIWNSFGKGNHQLNTWILNQLCDIKIYDELFRNCPIREIKRNLVSWTSLMLKQNPDESLKTSFLKIVIAKITIQNQNTIETLILLHNLIEEKFCFDLLIEKNLIGRMMQIIIRRQPRIFGQVEGLMPVVNLAPSQLGYEQIVEKTPFELKKMKYDNQSGIVWAIIYKMISRFRKQQLSITLHTAQLEYLSLPKQKIYKLLQQVKTKFDIDVLTNFLCYMSQQNYFLSEKLAEMAGKGIKQLQSKKYRQFFQLFKKLVAVKDSFAEKRISWIFYISRSLKQNQKYAMDCTIIELWMCKIFNENQQLRTYLVQQKNLLLYLADLPLKKVPSEELSKKNANYSEVAISKLHGIPFPTSHRGYIKLLRAVQEFYQKLLKGIYEHLPYFESGNHLVYDKLTVGDKIAYFDPKDKVDYQQAVIKDIFFDKLAIARKSIPNKIFWIWNDDQRLTSNLNVIKDQNFNELDSSKTTEMQDENDLDAIN